MSDKLKIHTWNANGVRNKLPELRGYLEKHRVDIMLINELRIKDKDKLNIRHYSTIRKLRLNDTGHGGVAILIRRGVPYTEVGSTQCSIENTGIKLDNNITIIAAYNSPSNIFKAACLHKLLSTSTKVIVMGDLNARHCYWDCQQNNRNGHTLLEYVQDHNDCNILYPDEHTHFPENNMSPSTLDIAITKNIGTTLQITTEVDLNSDHNPVVLTLPIKTQKDNTTRTITSYKNSDWSEYRRLLNQNLTIVSDIKTTDQLDGVVENLALITKEAQNKIAFKLRVKDQRETLPEDITQLIKLRNRYKKQWQKWHNNLDRISIKRLNFHIKTAIQGHRNKTWETKLQKLNPQDKSLWKLSKALKGGRREMPPLRNNGNSFATDEAKAQLIAQVFKQNHQLKDTPTTMHNMISTTVQNYISKPITISSKELLKNITSPKEIIETLKTLPNDKAPGHDSVDYRLLKNLPRKAIVQVLHIINTIIKLQYWPKSWKQAIVIPIHKSGKNPTQPTNYRPISLLPSLSKVTEKIILTRLKKQTRKLNHVNPYQFGFSDRLSTVHQVARIVTDVVEGFGKGKNTVMVLVDVEKAFDRVWHEGVIYKLIQANYPEHIIRLLHSYLTGRSMTVRVNNTYSSPQDITAGVPQGSVLGPHIYNLYLTDIPTFPNSNIALFADDTAVYSHSFYAQAASYLAFRHLDKIQQHHKTWKTKINPNKTELIVFSKKYTNNRIFTIPKIEGAQITPQQSVKYLGVHLDCRLNFRRHIKNTLKKAYNTNRLLYPLMGPKSFLNEKNKKLLYKTIIRPILTYAAPIWSGVSRTAFRPLESYQNKLLRLITNSDRYRKIDDMLQQTGMETLRDHTTRLTQNFYTKKLNVNRITRNITRIRHHNNPRPAHRQPYQHLDIYNQL